MYQLDQAQNNTVKTLRQLRLLSIYTKESNTNPSKEVSDKRKPKQILRLFIRL